MREALNGRPPADRTRRDYQRVINAYRGVYFGAPTSTKADPSVVAVAETLVEMGRRFDDDKILNEAIAQYKFLRKEYPGSKYRCDALFTIGEIYSDDLNDPEQARATFKEFLHRYPHNRLVEDAQQAIVELDREAEAEKKAEAGKNASREKADTAKNLNSRNSPAKDADAQADAASPHDSAEKDAETSSSPARLPRVTGIRHWSTPNYTRVAIDLESDVKFGSQRIANPDRIFFDLRGTKLASTLVGKTFDVDDGFLKKIRVAQFQPGRTRVVLEVDNLSDYEAFLLPNPYRLIIDIHGKDSARNGRGNPAKEAAGADAGAETTADVEEPPLSGSMAEVANSGLKAERKASAREAVGEEEHAGDQPGAESEDGDNSATTKPRDVPDRPKTREVEVKTATGTIKKVIVDADDDDSGAEAANVDMPKAHSGSPSHKADHLAGRSKEISKGSSTASSMDSAASSGDSADGDEMASEAPPANHLQGKLGLRSSSKSTDFDAREAKPTASGDRSLIRVLGLKIGKIVIDPGHGGHDTGTIGPDGLEEKDLVLDVGKRLGKLLEARLGAEVVYTRKDDTFIPLETRTAIANQQRADLFISIHANSSDDPDARGVETYYLNFTSSPDALEVAARENAVSEKSIYELQDLVKKIALKEKIEESREFAADVQESLHSGLAAKSPAIRDRGVKKAPFIVLIGANMPSILAEISFVSNPTDERRLETSEYRQRIAESLYRGIAKYADGLSGVKVASNKDKASAQ